MACTHALLCTQKRRLILVACALLFLAGIVALAFFLGKHHHSEIPPENWKGAGTTADLYEIILGRCDDYVMFVNPGVRNKDCRKLYQLFKASVMKRNQCNITTVDYEELFQFSSSPIPCNQSLLWSKTSDLAHLYAKSVPNILTLEDTLLGYVANRLSWCGHSSNSGWNYKSCPARYECDNNPVSAFWRTASAHFAKQACGVVHVMLNGSIPAGAIKPDSIFSSVEVPSLDPVRISEVRIWVMDNIDGPDRNSCSSKNQTDLEAKLLERNISSICVDNYWPVHILQCVRTPNESACKSKTG
ncbi:ADP-ribosyl cyclase/cyclic ADP-ribose hydrolase 1-like isoform X2 [Ambystoma mexicanum]|uniref:ADP-ribosyl cyclase/cyclic ADP-ribose hydrolase 1-like isoform X2 n=1 Tax=Ambystoma mexicanum TaxID=8296 RepID=UPI0037E97DCE